MQLESIFVPELKSSDQLATPAVAKTIQSKS